MKSIYVGNLPFTVSEQELRALFEPYGEVGSIKLITDKETGRPRGFGFVEMEASGAAAAIQALNGKEVGGRSLRINEAQEKSAGGGGSGGPRGGKRW